MAPSERADALRNRERILAAAERVLAQAPSASMSEIAAAAELSRSSVYRHFPDRGRLLEALRDRPQSSTTEQVEPLLPPGRLGRQRPMALDAIQVFDAVPPAALPDQLSAEAERIAGVPVSLYVLDIDGSHLLRISGSDRLPERIEARLAVGPELDADGLVLLRERLRELPGTECFPLWLRGRAIGVMVTLGKPRHPLTEMARQAAAAITLSDRYTDVFARTQRRKQPKAAAEIQQSLLPPRISRVTGGEVAGNILPSYEVAGDWFDVVENSDGVWITVADGLGGSTRAAASSAVALGALRASRRSGADVSEALVVMHQTLQEMPGPRTEMTAVIAKWEPGRQRLAVLNCGHVAPVVLSEDGRAEWLERDEERGLGGRAAPKPARVTRELRPGDRLVMVSDGVVESGGGNAGLGFDGLVEAALRSERRTAADTVREIHRSVLDRVADELADDATAVCLALG